MKITGDWLENPETQAVCAALTGAGHRVWFVGGCVRNALMGLPATDIDMTTDAEPAQVQSAAEAAGLKSIPTGVEHGTITVVAGGVPYEITTLRRDVETDGRHATVAFSTDIAEDAARRDLTMNALYATPDGTVHDPLGGMDDLQARRVRFIGDADARIAEDYLRILRFFRFTAIYGDPAEGIDADGLAACAAGADGLEGISAERIGAEMRKLLGAVDPAPAMAAMRASGVLMRILPGAGTGLLTVLVHVEQAAGMTPDWHRRMASLGGEDVAQILRLSKADATRLALLQDALEGTTPPHALGFNHGAEVALDGLALRAASFDREIADADIEAARHGVAQVFPLTAADLMPDLTGPAIGQAMRAAQKNWIASHFKLTREELRDGILKNQG